MQILFWLTIAKWVVIRKEFKDIHVNDILFFWESCMSCGMTRKMRVILWFLPSHSIFKFNVEWAAGPAGIGGVLKNLEGMCWHLAMFSMPVDVKDSNEVEVKALSVFPSSFHSSLWWKVILWTLSPGYQALFRSHGNLSYYLMRSSFFLSNWLNFFTWLDWLILWWTLKLSKRWIGSPFGRLFLCNMSWV